MSMEHGGMILIWGNKYSEENRNQSQSVHQKSHVY